MTEFCMLFLNELKLADQICNIHTFLGAHISWSLKFAEICITISKGEELRNEGNAYYGRVTKE